MSREKFNRLLTREKQNAPVTTPLPKLAPYAGLYAPEARREFLEEFDRKLDEWRKSLLWTGGQTVIEQQGSQTVIVNESPSSGGGPSTPAFPVSDDTFQVVDGDDNSKSLRLQLATIQSAVERTLTVPDGDGTIALLELAQTFSGEQSFSAPVAIDLGAITTTKKILDLKAEWNDATDVFEGVILDITNTASDAGSLPFDVRVDAQTYLQVQVSGDVSIFNGGPALFTGGTLDIANGELILGNSLLTFGEGTDIAFGTTTGTMIGGGTSEKLSFYGATPIVRPSAFTQTYSTSDKTLSAYVADGEGSSYSGIDNTQVGSVYATVADLNQLRVAYENLRVFTEDIAALLNSVVDDLQSLGLVG